MKNITSREIIYGNDLLANVERLNSVCTLRQVMIYYPIRGICQKFSISQQVDFAGCARVSVLCFA